MRRWAPLLLILASAAAGQSADAERGKELFTRRCTGCHSPDRDVVGPRLRSAFGRKAGSVPSFPYSDGLKKADIVWDERLLDRWLAGPEQLVPDTNMEFRVPKEDERAAIIAYLKSLAGR